MPADCNLLIIAGPRTLFSNLELQKIEQYLSRRTLVFAAELSSIQHPTGLEDILRQWGVNVGADVVQEPKNTISGQDVLVYNFSQHPVVDPLDRTGVATGLSAPRQPHHRQNPPADAPQVDELAFSSPASGLMNEHGLPPRGYPLMVAVEKNEVKGLAAAQRWPDGGGGRFVVS